MTKTIHLKIVYLLFSLALIITSCREEEIVVITKIAFENKNIELLQEDSLQLPVICTPTVNTVPAYAWTTLNPEIATVREGMVTGIKPGNATIIVSLVSDPALTDTCHVTIKSCIENIMLDSATVQLPEEDSIILTVKHQPAIKKTPAYTWVSLSPDIAKVDKTGKVIAIQSGTTQIIVTLTTDITKSDTCRVTVLPTGTKESPCLIYSVKDLQKIRDKVNAYNNTWGKKYYKLMNDLNFTGQTAWAPIAPTDKIVFAGSFDGNGKVISNISMNRNYENAGLFGFVKGGEIKNLEINWTLLASDKYSAGGIAGHITNSTKILDCIVTGNVYGKTYAGGIAGIAEGSTISNCSSSGDISAYDACGGIVGYSGSSVLNCHATGNITATGRNAGGITGTGGTVNGCYSTGNVSITSTLNNYTDIVSAGGIAGYGAYVYNSYAKGKIYAKGILKTCSGGIGGYGNYVVNCYATGDVTAYSASGSFAGGIVGTSGWILNCYATGNILSTSTGSNALAGGIEGSGNLIINNIAFSRKIMTVAASTEKCLPQRVVYYSYSSSLTSICKNNYVKDNLTVSRGISEESQEPVTQFDNPDNDGTILTADPLSVLNNDGKIFKTWDSDLTNGVALKKWVVRAGENDGYPVFE